MANVRKFKVSADKNSAEQEVSFEFGSDLNDPRWVEIGFTGEMLLEEAISSITIRIQSFARRLLKAGIKGAALEEKVRDWKPGTRVVRQVVKVVPTRIDAGAPQFASFTLEQLRALTTTGAEVFNLHLHPSYIAEEKKGGRK